MDILNKYKKLSTEDKNNLSIYQIFNSIYIVARNEGVELSDKAVLDIQDFAYDIYLEDEFYNFSQNRISDFITYCYIQDNQFLDNLDKLDINYSDILEAIDRDDYDFYKKDEMER